MEGKGCVCAAACGGFGKSIWYQILYLIRQWLLSYIRAVEQYPAWILAIECANLLWANFSWVFVWAWDDGSCYVELIMVLMQASCIAFFENHGPSDVSIHTGRRRTGDSYSYFNVHLHRALASTDSMSFTVIVKQTFWSPVLQQHTREFICNVTFPFSFDVDVKDLLKFAYLKNNINCQHFRAGKSIGCRLKLCYTACSSAQLIFSLQHKKHPEIVILMSRSRHTSIAGWITTSERMDRKVMVNPRGWILSVPSTAPQIVRIPNGSHVMDLATNRATKSSTRRSWPLVYSL